MLGREACQEGPLQRPRGTKGLSNLRVSSYSPCTLAACFVAFGSLGTSLCFGRASISRRSVPAVENDTGYLAREFAHTHIQLRLWELILIDDDY